MKKLAVHLHIYYQNQMKELLQYMQNLDGVDYDLYITVAQENADLLNKITAVYPQAKIWQVENRGYDIGPFIDFLHHIDLDDYEYILKLHTKGKKSKNYTWLNGHRLDNALWGRVLWDSMLKNKERLTKNLNMMDRRPKIGMLGSKYCFTSAKQNYEKLLPQINIEMWRINQKSVAEVAFIAGSMFLAKAKLLQPLKAYKQEDFEPTNGEIKEGTLAHIVERVMGALIIEQGYKIKAIKHDHYGLYFLFANIKRFLFQQKVTNSGKKLIKVCKLPIYSKPLRG